MATGTDLYGVLGIARNATDKEVKSAYRRLARRFHPDVNKGDKGAEEKFKEISKAYEVLIDPEKRKRYDAFGAQWDQVPPGATSGGGFQQRPASGGEVHFDFDIGSIFGDLFNRGGLRTSPRTGDDLQYEMEIGLDEAFHGGQRRLTLSARDHCPTCHGSGAEPGATLETCPQCKGSGKARSVAGIGTGSCDRCAGTGKAPTQACHTCRGAGIVERPRAVTVTIPAGVEDGNRLRIAGQGNIGANGGPSGDLYLLIRIRPHNLFERKGDNLVVELPVTFAEAALGAEVQVPTMAGKLTTRLPAGIQSGQQLRLAGQGMPRRSGSPGDLLARVRIVVPKNLTPREIELIEELRGLRSENPREGILTGR